MIGLDEMGPESAKSFAGPRLVRTAATADQPAQRATLDVDYGRRGAGYIFGAFRPHSGEAFTHPYASRSTANWGAFLAQVEAWLPPEAPAV